MIKKQNKKDTNSWLRWLAEMGEMDGWAGWLGWLAGWLRCGWLGWLGWLAGVGGWLRWMAGVVLEMSSSLRVDKLIRGINARGFI